MIKDPGKNKMPEQAKQARLQAWKRPRLKRDREKLRTERIKEAGYENSDSVQNESNS